MKRRKRKWRAPNNPTPQARAVWRHLFPGEPWPKGWKVEWAGFMRNTLGLCMYSRRMILLSYADARKPAGEVLGTLCHEFVHLRSGKELRHGKEFRRLERTFIERLGIPMRVRLMEETR